MLNAMADRMATRPMLKDRVGKAVKEAGEWSQRYLDLLVVVSRGWEATTRRRLKLPQKKCAELAEESDEEAAEGRTNAHQVVGGG